MKFHPLANVYPLLEGEEYERLKKDIEENGQREPIYTHRGMIIDGRNRWKVCQELGKDPKMREWLGSDDEIPALIDSLNLHRRHLTREQIREVIAKKLKAEPQKSNREVAKEVKADHKTVAAVRDEMTANGEIPHAQHIEDDKSSNKGGAVRSAGPKEQLKEMHESGHLGKSAYKEVAEWSVPKIKEFLAKTGEGRNVSAVMKEIKGPKDEPAEPETPTDRLGIPIKGKMVAVFQSCDHFRRGISLLKQFAEIVNEIAGAPGGEHYIQSLTARISGDKGTFRCEETYTASRVLKQAEPYASVCAYCHHEHPGKYDKSCKGCLGLGWITEKEWNDAPESYRKEVLKLVPKK